VPGTKTSHADTATLRASIDAGAAAFGDSPFLIEPESGAEWSYAQTADRARAAAARLTERGLRSGDRVAIVSENGPASVELMLGAWYGGFVPIPVQPTSGPRAIRQVLVHGEARLVFAADAFLDEIREVAGSLPVIGFHSGGTAAPHPVDFGALDPGAEALLIYTSGSTGQPKGVSYDQRGLLACARNTAASHALGPADRFLCTLPLYHMNSVDKLLGTWSSGGAVVLPARFEVSAFWRWVTDHRCTWLAIVPTLVAQLVRWSDSPTDVKHVRYARCSSAPLADADHRAFEERFGIPLLQGMGTTETGSLFLNPPPPAKARAGSLGQIHGYEARLIDREGNESRAGEPGLLSVRGDALMRGYHRDPAATREAIDSDGWFHTGDHAYCDADGFFYSAGRAKELIIKSGTNIAPREIDEVLESHSAVTEAAAVGIPDATLGEDILAFVVRRRGHDCSESELIEHCANQLGELKKPSAIRFVDELPHGPTGKVQRMRLRDGAIERTHPLQAVAVENPGYVEPRTETERALCEMWADRLGCDRVGVHDNFFALGGFSLIAFRLLMSVRRQLQAEIPVGIFFDRPTVAEQAAFIDERRKKHEGVVGRPEPLHPVREGCTATPLFCVYGASRYRDLAERLGERQPTYGLFTEQEFEVVQTAEDGTTSVSFPRVEQLAAEYIDQVRAIQPEGPVHLAGLSFGGRVALEMAQLLEKRGEATGFVAAFDTYMPGATRRNHWGWFRHHVANVFRQGPGPLLKVIAVKRRAREGRVSIARGRAPRATESSAALSRNAELRRRARDLHQPRPYAGKIVLFRAMQAIQYLPYYEIDPLLGWGRLALGELHTHDIPGSHTGMLRGPGVARIAELLRDYLPGDSGDPVSPGPESDRA
jgi:long-chain acyl-CoA synthetase